ncbi:MAG: ABC transporter permease [Alphaproteobacteria bacterium]|nr:ABC transporter permease [Alphaproteobacteria bacterium]
MLYFVVRRLGETLVTLLLVTMIVFCLARLTGDPTPLLLAPEATEEMRQAFREYYALDRSVFEQYAIFIADVANGQFGESFRFKEPAIDIALQAVGPTLKLTAVAMALSIAVGLPLGLAAAASRNETVKEFVNGLASLGQAMPAFWVGLMLVSLLALEFGLLPTSGYGAPRHYVLPALTLSIPTGAAIAGLTLANVEEALKSDFIRMERVLGLSAPRIVLKHALRNASLPIVTYLGLQFGLILSGAIVTERIFAWPGIGQRVVEAILNRDYPVVQAIVVLTAFLFMMINLLVDLVYLILNPRLRK